MWKCWERLLSLRSFHCGSLWRVYKLHTLQVSQLSISWVVHANRCRFIHIGSASSKCVRWTKLPLLKYSAAKVTRKVKTNCDLSLPAYRLQERSIYYRVYLLGWYVCWHGLFLFYCGCKKFMCKLCVLPLNIVSVCVTHTQSFQVTFLASPLPPPSLYF